MSAENAADLPLAGIRVLDVASYIAAPVAATILADFGADVIKIEAPAGDGCRRLHTMPGMPGMVCKRRQPSPAGASILITSAPKSAKIVAATGAAI